jgi:hypothetical protein
MQYSKGAACRKQLVRFPIHFREPANLPGDLRQRKGRSQAAYALHEQEQVVKSGRGYGLRIAVRTQ